jgi:hypothetical protein
VDDLELFKMAGELLSTLNSELADGIYGSLGGELSLQWDDSPVSLAYASSSGCIDKPPQHSVTIGYAFVRKVWCDSEQFCDFISSMPPNSDFEKLYEPFCDLERLPMCFSSEEQVKNLFIATITWVYFHELGHLMQEHGYIRALHGMGKPQEPNDVHEFDVRSGLQMSGTPAVVSHVTELAADFEATNFCLMELIRHITDSVFVEEENKTKVLSGLVYLMVCGISILFFRFNAAAPLVTSAAPQGSHPDPIIRLEINIPHIFETLSLEAAQAHIGHDLDRKQLVLLCSKAAFSATLYCSMTQNPDYTFDDRFIIKGLLARPAALKYLQAIVKCWDEILPDVKRVRRIKNPLGLLTFSNELRRHIAKEA